MNKFILIFIAGLLETYLFTGWNLSANKGKVMVSSFLMFAYMLIYLNIIDMAFKDTNTFWMIGIYALSCGVGNYLRVKHEKKKS